MGKKLLLLLAVVLVSAVLVSCASSPETEPIIAESGPEVEEAGVLKVGEIDFTQSQLESLETLEVEYTGKDDTVTVFSGVLVTDLLAEAGLAGDIVVFVANDGYEAELALAELEGCGDCVVAFDEDELRMVLPGFPGNVQVKGVVEIAVK